MATALTTQTDVTSGEAYRKENRLKTQLNIFSFFFITSETSDSFVNHFDGHFACLKTLDFYFKNDLGNPFFHCYFIVYYYILGVHQLIDCRLLHTHRDTVRYGF